MSAGPPNRRPKVFISYAHESDALRARVRALADWLGERGCEVMTDHPFTYQPPEEGWLTWMLRCLREADKILVVCTPKLKARYEKSAPPDEGFGATYEGAIVTQHVFDQAMRNTKFFPVLPDGGNGEDIPTTLRPWSNGHCFPSGNERILRLVLNDPAAAEVVPSPSPPPLPTGSEQARHAMRLLRAIPVQPFFHALREDIAETFPDADVATPERLVGWFDTCRPDQVQPLFWAVRRALKAAVPSVGPPDNRLQIEKAATALYCLAACRVVDKATGQDASNVLNVPNSESVVCAVIATAMFGGKLELAHAEAPDQPCCPFVFRVRPFEGSDQQIEELERAIYESVFANGRDATQAALDGGSLSAEQRARLKRRLELLSGQERADLRARLDAIRQVERSSVALVIVQNTPEIALCRRLAGQYSAPILLPAGDSLTPLLGMDAHRLLAEIKELWRMLGRPEERASGAPRPSAD